LSTSPSTPGWRAWLRGHPYTVVAAVVFVAAGVPFCLRTESEWERVFVGAAVHLRHGEDIYNRADAYLYPPFMAVATLPFTALPPAARRLAWLLVNLVATALLLRWAWRAAGGGRVEGAAAPWREHAAAVLGALCGVAYIENCLAHQQTDLVMGAIMVGGCLLLGRGRVLGAATCFGVAAAMKCTPLLFAPYLAWRRRPVAAAWVVAVALGVNLLPDLVHRGPAGRTWLGVYADRFLRPLTAADHNVGTWGSEPIYNQSLAGAVHRWCLTRLQWEPHDCLVLPRGGKPHPLLMRAAAYGSALVLLAAAAWAAGRPWRRLGELPGPTRAGLECAVVILLMLLLSPMSSMAHFGVLVLPGFCLARAAAESGNRLAWVPAAVAAGLGLLSSKDPLGERLYTVSLWCGTITWETLYLLLACVILLWRLKPAALRVTAAPPRTPPALRRAG
jgi:hypothetical protein